MSELLPDCSVIVPLFNRSIYTRTFLLSLRPVLPTRPRCEVILVNSGSTDDTAAVLDEFAGDHRVITLDRNRNFAGACNVGAQAARGRLLYFLNNDTVPLSGFLGSLAAVLDQDSEVGIVGSKLLFPDGTIQHAGIAFDRHRVPAHIYLHASADLPPVNRVRELQALTGASLMIRREDFEAVGGFDTSFRNSYEDINLCLRVRDRGRKVVYCPSSVLYHFESASPGRHDHDPQNLSLFLARWYDRVEPDEEQIYEEDGCVIPPRRLADTAPELEYALEHERQVRAVWEHQARSLMKTNAELLALIEARSATSPATRDRLDVDPLAVLTTDLAADIPLGEAISVNVLLTAGRDPGLSFPVTIEARWQARDDDTTTLAAGTELLRPGLSRRTLALALPEEAGAYELAFVSMPDQRTLARFPVQLRPRYGVRYELNLPSELAVSAMLKFPVTLENTGTEPWEGAGTFQLGYRWRTGGTSRFAEADGRAAILNRRVLAGERIRILAMVQTPPTAGQATLEWDLVEEGAAWFSSRGVATRQDPVDLIETAAGPAWEGDEVAFDRLLDENSRRLRERLAVAEAKRDRLAAKVHELETGVNWLRSEVETERTWKEDALAALKAAEADCVGAREALTEERRQRAALERSHRELESTRAVRWSRRLQGRLGTTTRPQ